MSNQMSINSIAAGAGGAIVMDDYLRDEDSAQSISLLDAENADASGALAQEHIAAKQLP